MKKYVVGKYSTTITEVEVVRETEMCVFVKTGGGRESREAKRSEYSTYCDTWQAAKDLLASRRRGQVMRLKESLERAQQELEQIEALEQPKERV